jgi:hypothetical protein
MKSVLLLLVSYLVVNFGIVASGVAIGFLLRWVLPSVDLGASILIGVVTTGLSIHFFHKLMALGDVFELPELEDDDLALPVRVYPVVGSSRSARKRKRK